jgi:hypothetical protein
MATFTDELATLDSARHASDADESIAFPPRRLKVPVDEDRKGQRVPRG